MEFLGLTFEITNTGDGTLSGSITDDKDWISVMPETFNTNAVTVNVTVDNEILNQTEGEVE